MIHFTLVGCWLHFIIRISVFFRLIFGGEFGYRRGLGGLTMRESSCWHRSGLSRMDSIAIAAGLYRKGCLGWPRPTCQRGSPRGRAVGTGLTSRHNVKTQRPPPSSYIKHSLFGHKYHFPTRYSSLSCMINILRCCRDLPCAKSSYNYKHNK